MLSNIVAISIVCVVISVILLFCRFRSTSLCLPSGPYDLPIIGSTLSLGRPLWLWAQNNKHRYGEMIYYRTIGGRCEVILNTYESLKQAFLTKASVFSGRPRDPVTRGMFRGEGLVRANGALWKEHRRFAMRVLRDYGFAKAASEDNIQRETTELLQYLRSVTGSSVDATLAIAKAATNVISVMVFNSRLGHEDTEFESSLTAISVVTQGRSASKWTLIYTTFTKYLPFFSKKTPALKKVRKIINSLNDYLMAKINQHRNRETDVGQQKDYIDSFLAEQKRLDESGEKHTFTDNQLCASIFDLYLAGTDTTTNALKWVLLYMALHPPIQEDVRAHINTRVASDSPISMSHRKELPLVLAVIEESQRLSTLVPLGVAHRCTETSQLMGFDIPRDCHVLPNLWAIHHDRILFPDPYTFNPYRFVTVSGEYVQSDYVIPFSIGKRACPGESLARMELFIFFASIIRAFKIMLPAAEERNITKIVRGTGGTVHAPRPHKLLFVPIDS